MYHPDTFYSQQLLVSNCGKFVMLLWSLWSRIVCLCFLPAFICIFKYKSFLYRLGFKYGRAGEWPWIIWAHILDVPKCHWILSVGELRLVLLRVVWDYFWYFLGRVILAAGMFSSYINWELSSLLWLVEILAIKLMSQSLSEVGRCQGLLVVKTQGFWLRRRMVTDRYAERLQDPGLLLKWLNQGCGKNCPQHEHLQDAAGYVNGFVAKLRTVGQRDKMKWHFNQKLSKKSRCLKEQMGKGNYGLTANSFASKYTNMSKLVSNSHYIILCILSKITYLNY